MKTNALKTALLLALLSLFLPRALVSQQIEDKVTDFTLRNGMRFVIYERHVAPVFFAAVIFNVGSINEWDGITGISHLLEHMMFKGTKIMGTKNYMKERKYLEKEDRIASEMDQIKKMIGWWRLGIFQEFGRKLVADLPQERKAEIGSDKVKELEALIEMLESGEHLPPEADRYPEIVSEDGKNYLDLYVELLKKERELEETMAEHRKIILSEEIWDAYLKQGARMLNAFTSYDFTGYIVYLPANRLELWAAIESDRMAHPVFREFYSERNVVCEERRLGENEPDDVLEENLYRTAYLVSPYGRPVIGWMCDIQNITRDDLENYYRRFYSPNNCIVVLVGDLDPAKVKRVAERYFGRIRGGSKPDPLRAIEPKQLGERRITIEFDAEPRIAIAYHVPAMLHPDSYPIDALAEILGTGRTSRLYKKVFEELQLTSSPPHVDARVGSRLGRLLVITAEPRHPHTVEEVENAIYEVIEELKKEPPTEREMQRLRNQIDAEIVRAMGSNLGMAFRLAIHTALTGDWRSCLTEVEKQKKVKAEDISRVAREYLTPQNRTVATLVKVSKQVEEGEQEEEIDLRALMQWVSQLPEEQRREIFMRVQSMNEEERKAFAKELMKMMKSQKK